MCTKIDSPARNGFPDCFAEELYEAIFNYLNPKALRAASQVNRLWHRIAGDLLWKHIALDKIPFFKKPRGICWRYYFAINAPGLTLRRVTIHRGAILGAWGNKLTVWTRQHTSLGTVNQAIVTPSGHNGSINCFSLCQRGGTVHLATGSADHTICIWERKFGSETFQAVETLQRHTAPVLCLAGNSQTLFSGDAAGQICVWKYNLHTPIYMHSQTVQAHSGSITFMQIDNKHLIRMLFSGSSNGEIKVWKKKEAMLEHIQTLRGHLGAITTLFFNHKTSLLFSGSHDKTIRVWQYRMRKFTAIATLAAHADAVTDIIPQVENNEMFFSCSADGTVKMWLHTVPRQWECCSSFKPLSGAEVQALAPSLADRRLQLEEPTLLALTNQGIAAIPFENGQLKTAAPLDVIPLTNAIPHSPQ